MKFHISATIDEDLLDELNRSGREERRSRSQIISVLADYQKFIGTICDFQDCGGY